MRSAPCKTGSIGSTSPRASASVLVVMMHSTLGVEKAAGETGWMGYFVEFARPFRMPDFFLIAGLFLASRINAPWRLYLDRKVLHFAYFYVLWLTIQFAFKAPGFAAEMGWAGVAARISLRLHRAVGHALVHLPPGALPARHAARQERALAARLGRRRGARDRADPYRLRADRRVRQPLRLFLLRLPLRDLGVPLRRRGGRRPRHDADGACALGGAQRHPRLQRLRRLARSSAWRSALPARWPSSRAPCS